MSEMANPINTPVEVPQDTDATLSEITESGAEGDYKQALDIALETLSMIDHGDLRIGARDQLFGLVSDYGDLDYKALEAKAKQIQHMLSQGLNMELVDTTATNPSGVQSVVLNLWTRTVQHARTSNVSALTDVVETEIHILGDVMFLLPAFIARTSEQQGLTLAELYTTTPDIEGTADDDLLAEYDKIGGLVSNLGLGAPGTRTLQRRAYTTFDENGIPAVHLQESNSDHENPYRISDEAIAKTLSRLGIRNDLTRLDGTQARAYYEIETLPVTATVEMSRNFGIQYHPRESLIACATNTRTTNDGVVIDWTAGYGLHDDLYKIDSKNRGKYGERLDIAGFDFELRTYYSSSVDAFGKNRVHYLQFAVSGSMDDGKSSNTVFKKIVATSKVVLIAFLKTHGQFDDTDRFRIEAFITNPKSGKTESISL